MPRRLFEEMDNWAGGINTAANADALTLGVSPRGLNSALTNISPDPPRALASKRKGGAPALTAPLSGEPAIIGQIEFRKLDGTKIHVLVGGDGSLRKRNADGSETIIDASAFTSGDERLPEFAVANDLLFITNGSEEQKFDGTSLSAFGIAKPVTPGASAGGVGGVMTAGDYDVLITYYNSDTGHESQISDSVAVTIASGEKITVTWLAPADAQVTHVRVYVRQRSRGANYYRAIAGTTPAADATHGGFPIATLSTVVDITDTQFENFKLLAPEENANVPPPDGARSPTWHRSRMFVHDGANIYWSEIEKPEAFNVTSNREPVNPDDGDEIVALHSTEDGLLVMKNRSTYILRGTTPTSWDVDILSSTIGAVNQQCVQSHGKFTFWWDAQQGPVAYGSEVTPIGVPLIGPTIDPELLNKDKLHLVTSVVDAVPSRSRIMWAVPELGQTRASLILPFNLLLKVWESVQWNPFDVASMAVADDSSGTPWVYVGGFGGKLFQWWNATNDGVPSGATHTGKITSSTSTTLTGTTTDDLTPGWTVDELKELYVHAISQDGLDVQRRRITANTADTLTVTPAWGTNPNSTYTFVVGGIDFQWDTPWMTGEAPFLKKRYEFLFIQASSPDSGVPVSVDVFFTYDLLNVAKAKTLELLGSVVYDSAVYDRDRYASAVLDDKFYRMSKTGKAWRARVRNIYPDQELTLLKVAMQSVLLSHKS